MKKKQYYFLSILLCLSITPKLAYHKSAVRNFESKNVALKIAQSDTIIITGKVKENKFPFPKANVKLKGTAIETLTDLDGNFSLKIPPKIEMPKITLVVSGIGMITKEVIMKKRNRKINIQIKPQQVIIE